MATANELEKLSLVKNFIAFVVKAKDQEMSELFEFMNYTFNDVAPTEFQKEFIDEFLGLENWGEYIMYHRKELLLKESGSTVFFRPSQILENLQNLRFFVAQECALRFQKSIKKKKVVKRAAEKLRTNLKKELKSAIENSYFDGVFDKCDGWCNVADVLIDNKLITLEDDDN